MALKIPKLEVGDGTLKPYVVAFLDLLGLKNRLLALDEIPEHAERGEQWAPLLKKSLGTVIGMRQCVSRFYTGYHRERTSSPPDGFPPELLSEALRILDSLRDADTSVQWFGDCVVISVPLWTESGTANVSGLSGLLLTTASTSLIVLGAGQCIRGGIDVGYGCEIPSGEILSAAGVKAYQIESRQAKYPRVILGEDLLGCMKSLLAIQPTTPEERVLRSLLQMSFDLLLIDSDGQTLVNPLHSRVVLSIDYELRMRLLYKALTYIQVSLTTAERSNCRSLQEKFQWLQRFFLSNLPSDWDSLESIPADVDMSPSSEEH